MPLPHFTPRQLNAFIAAAELSTFTAAARRLNLTPSGISTLIAELENNLGFLLFDRTTRRMALTAAGRRFLPEAMSVQRQISRAGYAAIDIRDSAAEVISVAAPMAVAATMLPRAIAAFRASRPATTVRILDTGVEWLADRVSTGEADLAVGPDREFPADVERIALRESRWVLWMAPDHPLARLSVVPWAELAGFDLVAAGRDHEHSVRPRLPPGSAAAAIAPSQIVENLSTALGLAAAGVAVSFSPDYIGTLAAGLGVVARPLVEPTVSRVLCLYRRQTEHRDRGLERFCDHLEQMLGDGGAGGRGVGAERQAAGA